jgi:hypothetical protein
MAIRCSSFRRCAVVTSLCAVTSDSNRCALRSAFAVSDATVWQNRTSVSENGCASCSDRSVRRKMAPMTAPSHLIGTTTIARTFRIVSAAWTLWSIGSFAASGMNTVSPDSKARLSSG